MFLHLACVITITPQATVITAMYFLWFPSTFQLLIFSETEIIIKYEAIFKKDTAEKVLREQNQDIWFGQC
jgi:hypothetical protein